MNYVVGIGIFNALLLPCGRRRLLQRRGRVFAFRSCGPGSIPTSGIRNFSAPCDISGFQVDSVTNQFKVGKYVVGIGRKHTSTAVQ